MRLTREQTLMEIAQITAKRGTCNRLQVGAVISRDGRIISQGYNGPPSGLPHCNHRPDDPTPCDRAVHAEMNAIAFAARHGVATDNAQLTVTHMPCINCAKAIINAGIIEVVFLEPYRDHSGVELLAAATVRCRMLSNGRTS